MELTVSVGTVNQTVASPRELFLEALRCEAVSVLMIHNHHLEIQRQAARIF